MYFLQRLLLLGLAGVAVIVAGFGFFLFTAEVGISPARYVVQDLAIIAAGLLGLLLCWRQGRKLAARRQTELETLHQFKGHSLEANARPLVQVAALAFFGLLAAGCGWAVLQGKDDVRLLLCAVLFTVLFVLMVPLVRSQYRPGRPTLRLDARGVDHAWFGAVPWPAVHGVYHRQLKFKQTTIHTLVLGVSEPARYLGRMPWIARLMTGKLRLPRGRYGALEIGLNPLDQHPLLVASAAAALRGRASPPAVAGWHPGMDDETVEVSLEMAYLVDNPDRLPPDEVLARMQAIEPRVRVMTDRLLARR